MKIFQADGKFYKFLNTVWEMLKLNFLWIIFSLPIITIGAATIAAFSITNKMINEEEGYVIRDFLDAFKKNLKQGIILGLITLFLSYSIYLNFELFESLENNPIIFLILGIVISFVSIIHLIYAYPLLARYENSIKNTLINSREITFKFVFQTLFLLIFIGLLIVVFIFNYTLMFIGLLFGPASIFLLISSFAIRHFRKIEQELEK